MDIAEVAVKCDEEFRPRLLFILTVIITILKGGWIFLFSCLLSCLAQTVCTGWLRIFIQRLLDQSCWDSVLQHVHCPYAGIEFDTRVCDSLKKTKRCYFDSAWLRLKIWKVNLASTAWSSSSFLLSCTFISSIWAWSSAIWSCRSVVSASSLRLAFSSSCRVFSSFFKRSMQAKKERKKKKKHTSKSTKSFLQV